VLGGFSLIDRAKQVARHKIPEPGNIQPSRVTGWVEITITRPSLYTFGGGVNSAGQQEITIQSPLIPTINPSGTWTKALYIGEFAPGLELTNFCF